MFVLAVTRLIQVQIDGNGSQLALVGKQTNRAIDKGLTIEASCCYRSGHFGGLFELEINN